MMLAKVRSKRFIACLVVFAIVGTVGVGLPSAKGWGGLGLLPRKAFNPAPPNGAMGVPPDGVVLEWSAGMGAVMHAVYFHTDPNYVAVGSATAYKGRQSDTTWSAGICDVNEVYYWRVDEMDAYGQVTEGDVWSFTTCRFWWPD